MGLGLHFMRSVETEFEQHYSVQNYVQYPNSTREKSIGAMSTSDYGLIDTDHAGAFVATRWY